MHQLISARSPAYRSLNRFTYSLQSSSLRVDSARDVEQNGRLSVRQHTTSSVMHARLRTSETNALEGSSNEEMEDTPFVFPLKDTGGDSGRNRDRLKGTVVNLVRKMLNGSQSSGSVRKSLLREVGNAGFGRETIREFAIEILDHHVHGDKDKVWSISKFLLNVAWNNGGQDADELAAFELATRRVLPFLDGRLGAQWIRVTRQLSKHESNEILNELVRRGNPLGYDGLAQNAIMDAFGRSPKQRTTKLLRVDAEKYLAAAGKAARDSTWHGLAMLLKAREDINNAVEIWETRVAENSNSQGFHYILGQAFSVLRFSCFEGTPRVRLKDLSKSLQYLDTGSHLDPMCAYAAGRHYFCTRSMSAEDHEKLWGVPPNTSLAAEYFGRIASATQRQAKPVIEEPLFEGRIPWKDRFVDVDALLKEAMMIGRRLQEPGYVPDTGFEDMAVKIGSPVSFKLKHARIVEEFRGESLFQSISRIGFPGGESG